MLVKIEIETGNDAMLTQGDIADALRSVAHTADLGTLYDEQPIQDINGNTVGRVYIDESAD